LITYLLYNTRDCGGEEFGEIEDPFGLSPSEYRAARDRIVRVLEGRWIPYLKRKVLAKSKPTVE
jgi:hypothetical protein